MGNLLKEAVRHQEPPMGTSSANTMDEIQESLVRDDILTFPLSGDLDNDISGCLVSSVQGQNRLDSVCRQTKIQWCNTKSNRKLKNAVQGGNPQQKPSCESSNENRKKCSWSVSYPCQDA